MKDWQWNHKIFNVQEDNFDSLALELFRFQYENNAVYKAYADALKIKPASVSNTLEIPFLPIEFFKSQRVVSTSFEPIRVFESSGTTGMSGSLHYVKDISLYEESFIKGFEMFYGPVSDYCLLCLLPSYLERKNSSLVYMADKLIRLSGHPQSNFYLYDMDKLADVIFELEKNKQKTILLGVMFALLDFADKYPVPLKYTIVMETGGMKGRKQEMIRREAHEILKKKFGITSIHSEYGMTEALSQAYSKGEGLFHCPPWFKVLVRGEDDPMQVARAGTGVLNMIDLANVYSCCFIAGEDAVKKDTNGSFEILGRTDNSDLRGCSLMVM